MAGTTPAPSAKSPKKKSTTKPKRIGRGVSYLIVKTLSVSKERSGVSLYALKKALAARGYDVEKNNTRVRLGIKYLVTKGTLIRTKGFGASGSFKLNKTQAEVKKKPAKKAAPKAKKPAAKKPTTAKKAKTAAAKKPAAKKSPKKAKKPAATAAKKTTKSPKKAKKAAATAAKKTTKSPKKAKKPATPKKAAKSPKKVKTAKPKTTKPKPKAAKPKKAAPKKK